MLNITAPINTLSYGLTSLNLMLELDKLGIKLAWWPIGPTECDPQYHHFLKKWHNNQQTYDYFAPSLRIYHQNDMAQHIGKGKKCGLTIFELDRFSAAECHHLRGLDHVFVCSEWAKNVCINSGICGNFVDTSNPPTVSRRENVSVVPLGIDTTLFSSCPLPDNSKTVFINIGKWEVRKGHDILVDIFNSAFTPADNVELIMCCHNPFPNCDNSAWEMLYMNTPMGRAGKIKIIKQRFDSQSSIVELIKKAHCGIFPSRAEGWNLPLLECMAMGRHVITTEYSAHTEFCNDQNAMLVQPIFTEPANDEVWFFGQGEWAKIEQKHIMMFAEHMRSVHKKNMVSELTVNKKGIEVGGHYTWKNSALKIIEELKL